jgi:hypothetical protein
MAPAARTALVTFPAAFVYAAFTLLTISGHMPSGDSLYHFGFAREIAAGTLAPSPAKLLPWTVYAALPVDHYWGFHLLLAPFALLPDPELGMKLASATLFGALLAAMTAVLARRQVPLPWAWACASMLFSSQDWRFLQLRGGVTLAAALLVFVEAAAFLEDARQRRLLLLALAYAGALSYNGALLLLPFHGAALLGLAAAGDREVLRARLAEPMVTGAGLLLGFCLNPYMTRDFAPLRFAAFHAWHMGTDSARLFVGRENVEYNPFPLHLLPQQWEWIVLVAALLAAGAYALRRGEARGDGRTATLVYGSCTLLGLLLTLRAVRMREYAVPLAFLFLGVATRDLVERWLASRTAQLLIVLLLLLRAGPQIRQTHLLTETGSQPIGLFAGARPLLEKERTVVANLVQGDATFLYWEWLDVQVASGLSHYFLYLHDRTLYDHLKELRDAQDDEKAASALRSVAARGSTLLSARPGIGFHRFAERHPELLEVAYQNEPLGSALYRIR